TRTWDTRGPSRSRRRSGLSPRSCGSLCPAGEARSDLSVQEIRRRMVGREPVAMLEKVVNLIGEDELLELDAAFAKCLREHDALVEGNVAVVVAVNQEHGGSQTFDECHGSGLERQGGHDGVLDRVH